MDNCVTLIEWRTTNNALIDRDYIRPDDTTPVNEFIADKLRNEWSDIGEGDVITIQTGWEEEDSDDE